MRRTLATCLLLALALPCHAQPKPNTLTAKEIADGWILLFDGETMNGWKVGFSSAKRRPVIKDGVLELGALGDGHILSDRSYTNFELQLEYLCDSGRFYLGFNAPMREDGITPISRSHVPGPKKDWTLVKFKLGAGKMNFEIGANKSTSDWSGPAHVYFGQNRGSSLRLRNVKLRQLAQEKSKPNTLTPKEVADGWILLFDGETTFGWEVQRPGPKTSGGGLDFTNLGLSSSRFMTFFASYELVFDYKSAMKSGLALHDPAPWLINPMLIVLPEQKAWATAYFRMADGKAKLECEWTKAEHATALTWSQPGFGQNRDGDLMLRNIKLRPLSATLLFNGKDLTGWKIFPNKKSKIEIKDGAIHIKNGPGDLQTVGKYKDFILQLECKSNGKHLNSGIFFRCRANEYQNGYEAQIRNQFTDKPTQKYLIEEYDPKTNKLTAKKEQFFAAVDYGTGAIYRRQPARKQMSKDGEWFTMTIVAHGNHFATWVNGIQVTDWTDHRPKSDNARKGCCLNAGHISIQGHDPTTDLSFRNIRIAELK